MRRSSFIPNRTWLKKRSRAPAYTSHLVTVPAGYNLLLSNVRRLYMGTVLYVITLLITLFTRQHGMKIRTTVIFTEHKED